jgi:hypothetical protein
VLVIDVDNHLPRDARRLDDLRRDARRWFSGVVSYRSRSFYWLHLELCLRHTARRQFASVVSYGLPGLMCATFGTLSRRRDARPRLASVVSYSIPRLIYAVYEVFRRGTRGVATLDVGLPASCLVALLGSSTL